MMTRQKAITLIKEKPYKIGHAVGFNKLTNMHNDWIKMMLYSKEDTTLQAFRGSYKTTCVSLALALLILVYPNTTTAFMRKTDNDCKEIIAQVKKILQTPTFMYLSLVIWGVEIKLIKNSMNEILTNLYSGTRGTPQLVGMGTKGSLTGKHFDRIFTDDIINVEDRTSKAERDRIKLVYQELQNIKNRGGRIFNTGTPWHKDDAFTLMPNPIKVDCYNCNGLISDEQIDEIKRHMTASLFAANYELRHIAAEDVIFSNPNTGAEPELAQQGVPHIDAAYHGEDFTVFTIVNKKDGKYYVFGKMWRKHIDDVEDEIITLRKAFNAGRIHCEDNGDKGYLAKSLSKKGERVSIYHESMNKYLKITSYLKDVWEDVIFVKGTDKAYIEQICDYNENAEHDDAPDSLASVIRMLWKKQEGSYKPLWNGGLLP